VKMTELGRFDLPDALIQLWREREGETLLPLQEHVVKKHGLFDGRNLLIQAPTSSGKTFIGEMAAIHTALRRKKVVYLVPLKALAEEKYLDFKEKYESYGMRVIVSTRDHRGFDEAFEEGRFSIAVVVYEKLAQFLVRRPERFSEVELVIADELEILSDPDRGALVELMLTQLIRRRCRLIGISAVIGHAAKLAEWMGAQLIQYERRPVELRYGVLHGGQFRYRTYNEFSESIEQLADVQSDSVWEILTETLAGFVSRGESCLVFVKARHEARRGAELLGMRLRLPSADGAIDALRKLEATHARDTLMDTLSNGVGFHNADLQPEERRLVEQAFRTDQIRVLVSTSTLAMGMNMPAQNVFIAADKWRYDSRFGMPWKAPILRAEYENMGGRAGRFGFGMPFGRSILIAATPFDQETLWRRYVEGEREGIEPKLAHAALEDHVLRLVASHLCRDEEELSGFFESTLSGCWIWVETLSPEEVGLRVRAAVAKAMEHNMLATDVEGRLVPTPMGAACTSKGIRMVTSRELERWIVASQSREWCEADLLFAAALAPDAAMMQVSLTAREYELANYPAQLKQCTEADESDADVPLEVFRRRSEVPVFEECRAIKAVLFLLDWIDGVPMYDIEERYHTTSGQVQFAAEQIGWLLDAAATLAAALGCKPAFVKRIALLAERTAFGLREDELPLARLGLPGLSRGTIALLAACGFDDPEAIAAAPLEVLERSMDSATAQALHAWARRTQTATAESPAAQPEIEQLAPVLVIDDRQPGEIRVDGTVVPVQEKQYRLIELLAMSPGQCVSNETIYQALWDDTIVEQAQISAQKARLIERIRRVAPERAALIKVIPKRGMMLMLSPGEILLHQTEIPTAA
jgi:helicase